MISVIAELKRKYKEKPWLYEEEEHAVLKFAEDAAVEIEYLRAELARTRAEIERLQPKAVWKSVEVLPEGPDT